MSLYRALMVGINAYPGAPLRGCINDVNQMKGLLKQYYGFTDDSFKILLDGQATAANIIAGLEWLADGGDDPQAVRVFHYSGHGSYVADQNGDEPDGRDECLVPVDYQTVGMLVDDTLKSVYHKFPRHGNLTLIMDSCHSGTVNRVVETDITYRFIPVTVEEQEKIDAAKTKFESDRAEYVYKEVQKMRDEKLSQAELKAKVQSLLSMFDKKRFGDIRMREANILMAGCRPDQTSADAYIQGEYHGAFTYFLAKAITASQGKLSYRQLADVTGKGLSAGGFVQIPQLEYRSKRDGYMAFMPFPVASSK